jgi:LmbE family N-acetylglucosaminyl deacetylase
MTPMPFSPRRTPRGWFSLAIALACACAPGFPTAGAAPAPPSADAILQELDSFREAGTVLFIAAHPDDENNQLIAYLARGPSYRTGYLSLTRGEGGQDLLGPELGDALGVIRSQELLAARRIDGGRQFFSRARDFGFSKDYQDTLKRWDRTQVVADIVRVIRTFRPDILITRFSTQPGNTHGHHTASAVLALEAFGLAGDPKAFPEQLETLTPWQPKRIYWDSFRSSVADVPVSGGAGKAAPPVLVHVDDGGFQPLLGESFGEIAALSRSMHKSQGMGASGTRGSSFEFFRVLAGAPAAGDLFDGVNHTWSRFPGGADVGTGASEIIAHFDPQNPSASVPALLDLRRRLAAIPADPVVDEKRAQLDHILQECLGLYVETSVPRAEVVPGETLAFHHTALVQSGFPVRWLGVRYPLLGREVLAPADLAADSPATRDQKPVLPAGTPLSQPYWLREEGTEGMFRVDDASLIGRPENPPAFPVEFVFEVGGQTVVVPDQPVQITRDPLRGEVRRQLQVIPPVTLEFVHDLELFAPGSTRSVTVELTAARAGAAGSLRLEAPAGWQVEPAAQPFALGQAGDRRQFAFTITAPAQAATAGIVASAEIGGVRYRNRRVEIHYDHIPEQLMMPPARLNAVSLELAIRGRRVGYFPGAGDRVGECLERMGYAVTTLGAADVTADGLRGLDAVVLGIRAFNTRPDLVAQLPALFAYVQGGGNVIVQYNTPNELKTNRLAPYSLSLSTQRVTDDHADMILLAPEHPAVTTPNRIGPADFEGWVQERGLDFPDEWDAHFTPLLSCHDAGGPPLTGSLLVARYGQGYWVYSGLSWFRELPAGVPGAYRLFANLIALGK